MITMLISESAFKVESISDGKKVYYLYDEFVDQYQVIQLVSKFSKIKEIIGNSFYYTDLLKEDYLDLYNEVSKGRILVKD